MRLSRATTLNNRIRSECKEMSSEASLEELGFQNVYYVGYDDDDLTFWIAAMKAKYEGKGNPFGRKEWDHILCNTDVRQSEASNTVSNQLTD